MRTVFSIITLIITITLITSSVSAQRAKSGAKNVTKENDKTAELAAQPAGPIVVKAVISGDLLELESGQMLRLMGVDAPVMPSGKQPGQEPWASEARKFTEDLVLGKEIVIKDLGLKSDEYGRRVGLVYIGETWLDLELVKNGFAMVQPNPYLDNRSKSILVEAQREARGVYRGIWNSTNPLAEPPREFRAANKISEGDDGKADAWKRNAVARTVPRSTNNPGSSTSPGSKNGTTTTSENGSNGEVALPLQAARDTIESLLNMQERINAGVKSGELSRLVATASDRFASLPSNTDRQLSRDLKDAIDAYRLVLDAFKRKETSVDIDRERFVKYINGALDIAERATTSASDRLTQLSKAPRR